MPQSKPDSPECIVRNYEELKGSSERSNFESLWQNVGYLVNPTTDFNRTTTPGEERRNKVYDPTAINAAVVLGATVHTLAMNPATEWFNLAPEDPTDELDDEGRAWLYGRTLDLLNYYNSAHSGFNQTMAEVLHAACSFGTAPFVRDPLGDGQLPKYYSVPLSNFVIDCDPNGDVTCNYREIEYKAKDLVAAFGRDNVSEKSLKMAEKDDGAEKIKVLHAVLLNDREFVGKSPFNKPWSSIYVECDQRHTLREGGFDHDPYNVLRWRRNPAENYGRSPGIDNLPEIRKINVITRDALIAGELVNRPPMMVPANSVEGPIRTAPGSINYYQVQTRDRPEPMQTGANPGAAQGMIQDSERKINEGFFSDLMRLPDNDRMTATEIIARQNQRLQVMSPLMARLQPILNSVIKADFDLMLSRGMFPEPPQSLDGKTLRVEYKSPMAIAQSASQANNFLQYMNVAAPLIQADPSLMMEINSAETFRQLAVVLNAQVVKFKDPEVVAQQKQAMAQQQAAAQQASTAAELAGASKDAADAVNTASQTEQLRLTG